MDDFIAIIIIIIENETINVLSVLTLKKWKMQENNISCFFWSTFDLLFSKPIFPIFLQLLERKVLDSNGPHICMSQTKISNFCLLEISKFCLSSSPVVLSATTAYTSLCRGLKYLLKNTVFYSRLSWSSRNFDFWDPLFGQIKNVFLCLKRIS